MRLILASSSRYRKALLDRLALPFEAISPDIDESRRTSEAPSDLVQRLAVEKARAVAAEHPQTIVIGSDQLAELDDDVLGKAGSVAGAEAQLARLSGRCVRFLTGLCVISEDGREATHLDVTTVVMRELSSREIARYVELEQPLDCAGSFKSEGLGAALFERVDSSDPTALIGLPVIATARLLRDAGLDPLAASVG